jgi:hypothetical protein
MSESLKKMLQDARNWQNVEEELKKLNEPLVALTAITQSGIHLKGYIFDSLAYRYIVARNAAMELDILREGISYEKALSRATRDKVRFFEILREAIGEHD